MKIRYEHYKVFQDLLDDFKNGKASSEISKALNIINISKF